MNRRSHFSRISRRRFLQATMAAAIASALDNSYAQSEVAASGRAPQPLTAKEVGHLRHFHKLAHQLPGDWSEMGDGAMGWLGVPERTLRYQIANMAYAVASVQYDVTPAYREFYQQTLGALFQRLLEPDCWKEWANVSRGGGHADPLKKTEMAYGEFDPIRRYNIMYGGHVLQVASLYEMLYAEGKFTRPGSIRLEWVERNWGPGPQVFEYDIGKIVDVFVQQLKELNYEGFPCEPNLTFPECPQHAVLGMMLADGILGTKYSETVRSKYLESFQRLGFVDPKTQSFTYAYQRRQKSMLTGAPMAWGDGWTGAFMHAWAPEFIEQLYPAQRDRHVPAILDRRRGGLPEAAPEATAGLGYIAVYASELGDKRTIESLLQFADEHLHPVWREGRYFYPRNDDVSIDANGVAQANSALQGNALIPFARLLRGRGLWRMHNRPWTADLRKQPQVAELDYMAAGVSEAYYDADRRSLSVGLIPGPLSVPSSSFKVVNLDRNTTYKVLRNGTAAGSYPVGADERGGIARSADGVLHVRFDPREPATFSVVAI